MKINVCKFDRILRLASGVLLVAWAALLDGPLWAWIGIIPLVTGSIGFCPIYAIVGISSCPEKSH